MIHKTRIIFRADGNSRIGLGHVVRSLALAEMLRDSFECVFAIQTPSKELQEQIRKTCDGIILLPACTPEEDRFIHELNAYIAEDVMVVLDGYDFNTAYQQNIKDKGCQLCCIDDIHAFPFVADVVINQAGGISLSEYIVASYTKLLLGPYYALLRPPFLRSAKTTRHIPSEGLRAFISLGGADPQNHTLKVAQQLDSIQGIDQVDIVTGSAYRYMADLKAWTEKRPKYNLHQNLDAETLCTIMQTCAIGITSSSGVAYEYTAVGGLLFILQTADNQTGLYNFLIQNRIAHKLEQLKDILEADLTTEFEQTVAAQRQCVDGKTDERVKQVFANMELAASILMREATKEDLMLLFNWANDPEVRRHSFNPNPILPESHTRWFTSKLEEDQAKLYIAEANGIPAAHIRFEIVNGKAIISYLIASDFRSKGLGHVVLQRGVNKLLQQNSGLNQIEGLVQKDNIASVRAFEKAGFTYGTPDPKYPQAHRFELLTENIN